jgi:hypothetical protein
MRGAPCSRKIAQVRPPARQAGIRHPRRIRSDAANPTLPQPSINLGCEPAYVTRLANESG